MRRVSTRFCPSPLNLFRVPSAFWLVLSLAGQPLCGLWLRVGHEVECTVLRVWEQILTEQILIKETVGSPEAFFFPDVFRVGGLQRSLLLAGQPLCGL